MQIYHRRQDAGVSFLCHQQAGCRFPPTLFAQNTALFLKQRYLKEEGIDWHSGSCGTLPRSECKGGKWG